MSNEIDANKTVASIVFDTQQSGAEAIKKETVNLMELERQYDKTSLAQNNYVKNTIANFQKQTTKIAEEVQKQKELLKSFDNMQVGVNFSQSMEHATTSLSTFKSATPSLISSIGEIITKFSDAKEAVVSGVPGLLGWGAAIVSTVGVAADLIVSNAEKRMEEEREAINSAAATANANEKERASLEELSETYVTVATKLASGNVTYSESIELKKQLSGIQDQLANKYGVEADAIDVVNGNIRENIELLRAQAVLKAQKYTAENYSSYDDATKKLSENKWYRIEDESDYGTDNNLRTTVQDITRRYVDIRNEEIEKEIENGNKELKKIDLTGDEVQDQYYELIIPQGQAYDELDQYNKYLQSELEKRGISYERLGNTQRAISESMKSANTDEIESCKEIREEYEKNQAIIDSNGANLFKGLEVDAYIIKVGTLASSLSELASAYNTVANGGTMSADSLKELTEKYPLLAEYVQETGDLSLANGEKIKEAYEAQRQAMINTLTEQKAAYTEQLNDIANQRTEVFNGLFTGDSTDEEYSEICKQFNEMQDNLSAVNAELEIYNSELETVETQNLTETINEQRTSLENLASAYKSLSSGQQLSTDSVMSLTQAYPQLQQYIAETGDLTFSNGEVIKQAYQDEYDEMIKNLEAEKERLETLGNEPQALQAINAELQIYKACLADINEAPSFTDISGELKGLANAYRELSDSKQLDVDTMISMIDKYPEVASAIAAEGSLTKNQADIFKTLFEAKKNDYILTQQKAADNLKASLAETEGVIANISAQIEAYKKLDLIMGAIAATGLTLAMNTNKEQAATIKKEIEKVEARINAVQKIGVDTYGKSDSTSSEITSGGGNKDTSNKALAEELRQLEQKKSLGKLTAKQEYDELVRINKKYKKNADEKMDMEKRLYNAKKAWQDDIEASRKAKLQKEYDDIDHKKAMGQMTTAQELAQLEKIRKTYKLNAEEKKELDEKIYALKKQQAEELEQANSQKLQEEYKNIENLKSLGKMTAKEELAQLEKIRKKNKMNAEERMELEIKIYNLKKEVKEDEIDSLNNLAGAVTEALKNKYEEQQKLEEEYINESIKSWQTWEDETVAAIQGQIDSLDELAEADDREAKRQEYENKRQQLEMQLAYEKDDYNRKSIERELAKLDTDEAKRIAELEREDLKKSLQQEIENVKKESEQQQQQLQESLEANNKKYDELTSDASLKAQTAQMLMNSSQEEIVNFIKGYAPNYDLAGQTIGESLYNGFKSKVGDIESYIDNITNKITSYQSKLAKTANTAADKFWSTRSSFEQQISAAQAPAPVSVNQTVNFNQPVTTPVQTKRQLNTVSQALAQQIVNGG